jgi:hypothetical protein
MNYLFDTNVWVQLAQKKITCADLSQNSKGRVVIAPFVIMELMKESVKHAGKYFENDKRVFECMASFEVLPLTQPFIYQRLWNSAEVPSARVVPETYKKLLQLIVDSTSYTEFLKETKAPGSEWSGVERWDTIHQAELDKELSFVRKLAEEDHESIAIGIAKLYPLKGSLAGEDRVENEFSAALEYLRSLVVKVKNGANLPKNDRGAYVDFQVLFYLADANTTIVSNEDFSSEISNSPQKDRIIALANFLGP